MTAVDFVVLAIAAIPVVIAIRYLCKTFKKTGCAGCDACGSKGCSGSCGSTDPKEK